ncbi:MAG TPA: 3-hydroxyacyl-CoA dehydrogenase family protein [Actinobacteria bacterium]|nr:putative 3-hydroxybutyryl-CoA dehydrogenase [bacterium BMS3Bbin01]HDH27001.1 3-hydroxyacyl-CoA dehydrogenase family protein [Actinomycetota bacterium]HDL48467.1 3-hydroxyacyl-CoA dehydrogenase family protein [Actinomycetota bacterium]
MVAYERAAIVGTGTMGPGMGAVLERIGTKTCLYDIDPAALERAKVGVELARGVLDRLDAPQAAGGSIEFSTSLEEAVGQADIVMEAVPENLELKRKVFGELVTLAPDSAVLSSNTSGIPITKIAEGSDAADRIIGMHWSNPPHLIPLIEVVPGEQTSDAVKDQLIDFVHSFGYEAVTEREVPGFVENRILYAVLREVVELVERGIISHADMDTCVKWGIGYKLAVIGPLELIDMAGLDIYNSVGSYLNRDLSTASEVSSLITDRVAEGRLGIKTLGGIYDYNADDIKVLGAKRAAKLIAVRKALAQFDADQGGE